ncbi:hypothetical protein AMATHDRAFT_58110 [Amanita thiersii Skay4041]|uniref:Zn(2)-C6 fungal-type domain-containing protein n=1 Tax=Amanita thiersii Skay4041 TaxID=703135 RepID=A0A2A9NUC9_9AGAR|nr:hypothetical protein AMATHDRAFT_58110 [Amanita thiersii Skay4041]
MHPNLQSSAASFLTNNLPRVSQSNDQDSPDASHNPNQSPLFMKGPKRKRLAKACDACHKSKRRCDGTAPCSNCYYASKACTYTDASGRPVPAPRPFNPERSDSQIPDSRPQPYTTHYTDAARFNQSHSSPNNYSPSSSAQSMVSDMGEDDSRNGRKRFRSERGNPISPDDIPTDGPISGPSMDRPTSVQLDHSLTRELTNLFFTHCHPARTIIHKPSFSTALSHNQVPLHLIHAICALAAPLSKQPRIRTTPPRFAGKPFAQEALSIMFDGAGRLVCEPNLATAQALCLLQLYDIIMKDKMSWNTRYHDLALQIVKGLGVHIPDNPLLTPIPSPEFIQSSLERESVRRIFWLIHMLDVMASIYFKKPLAISENELRLRLPADETSFELAVHSTLPEYIYLQPIKTQYASEFGHLIRILTIYAKVEYALDTLNGLKDPDPSLNPAAMVVETEERLQEWANSLPDHLRFSEQSLSVQQSMFETSSNNGAWCYCCMHVYYASCLVALNNARQIMQRAPIIKVEPQWAVEMLDQILNMLGDRAKNSLLMCAALWTYIQHCGRDDPQIHVLAREYEDWWGTKMVELVQEWRSRMHPSQQQLYQFLTSSQHTSSKQPNTLKRRISGSRPSLVNNSNNSNHSPILMHSRLTPRHQMYTQGETPNKSVSPPIVSVSGHRNCDTTSSNPSEHHSNGQCNGMSPILFPQHGNDTSRIDLPPPSGIDPSPLDPRHPSPTLNSVNQYQMSRYAEDSRHHNPGGSRHQSDGKDSVRMLSGSNAVRLFGHNSGGIGSGTTLNGTSPEGHSVNQSREHQKTGWDRDRDQIHMGYGARVKKENGYMASSGPFGVAGNGHAMHENPTSESSNVEGKSSQRTHHIVPVSLVGDGLQSLPSLKASGLLDSWTTPRAAEKSSQPSQARVSNGTQQGLPNSQKSPVTQYHKFQGADEPGSETSRNPGTAANSGMPVGLQWLANESR